MNVALTGASGFLGRHIADALAEAGHTALAVVRTPAKATDMGLEIRQADLGDPQALQAAFAGCDAVVGNAALSVRGVDPPWEAYEEANVQGAVHVLEAAAAAQVRRVVAISTIGIYRTRLFGRHDEETPQHDARSARFGISRLTTNWKYMLSKAEGESAQWRAAERLGLDLTTLRPGPIYGSRDHKFTANYKRWLRWPIIPAPTFRAPHVHAGDVARAVVGALSNAAAIGRAYNVAGESVSPYRALCAARAAAGAGGWVVPIPVPAWVDFDDSAAMADLGFERRSIEAGMEEVFRVDGSPGGPKRS